MFLNPGKLADYQPSTEVGAVYFALQSGADVKMCVDNISLVTITGALVDSGYTSLLDTGFNSGIDGVTNQNEARATISSELREGSTTDKVLTMEKL